MPSYAFPLLCGEDTLCQPLCYVPKHSYVQHCCTIASIDNSWAAVLLMHSEVTQHP
jgi:hypothetical protein